MIEVAYDMDRVEAVAELLCKLDGKDPDETVELGTLSAVEGAYGSFVMAPERGGQWRLYLKEAEKLVAVDDFLSSRAAPNI